LPFVRALIGIPFGVGFDWAVFAFASVHILGVFPADLLQEDYDRHIREFFFFATWAPYTVPMCSNFFG